MKSQFGLKGRVAVVTGGAGMLGFHHSRALIENGASVYVADIDTKKIEATCRQLGFGSYPIALDVTCPESVERALSDILRAHGRVDILVNNAAIDPKVSSEKLIETSRLENFSVEQWNFQLSVGLTGAFLCSQAFGTWMAENGGGCVLNIASDLSVFAPDQRIYRRDGLPEHLQPVKPVTYSVIKTALLGLTRYLAAYWASQNVRVNALSPGGVYTDQDDEFVRRLTNLIPLGRMADTDEYTSAIQFLCSDASRYMTGQNIVIDGGRSIL